MTPNLTYCCDTPDCKSTCTLNPEDAKNNPVKALKARGWEACCTAVSDDPEDGNKIACVCSVCAMKKEHAKHVPVPAE